MEERQAKSIYLCVVIFLICVFLINVGNLAWARLLGVGYLRNATSRMIGVDCIFITGKKLFYAVPLRK